MRKSIIVALICIFFLNNHTVFAEGDKNLVKNPGFENKDTKWSTQTWEQSQGASEFLIDEGVTYSGNGSATISNNLSNDARYTQVIKVKKNTYYKLSCWIKTENVGLDNKGANLSVNGIIDIAGDVRGTSGDWVYAQLYGITGKNQKELKITLGVGGYYSTNSGTAWFDEVSVIELDELPSGVSSVNLFTENSDTTQSLKGNSPISFMYTYTIVFFLMILLAYYLIKKRNSEIDSQRTDILLMIVVFAALFKMILAPKIEGFSFDISCFMNWAYYAAKDLPNFYNSGIFCDYPPFYILILAIIGHIAELFNLSFSSHGYLLLIKLPSIIADSVTAYLLYRESKAYLKGNYRLLLAFAYVFNPAVMLNSTLWGQVDSFFIMIIVSALLLLMKKKIKLATIAFAIAVLMKPQGIIFLPILFFELVKRKKLINFVYAFITGIITVIVVILPFSLGKNPFWIVKLYMNTAGSYKYATLNAYNFFGLLGGNVLDDSTTLFIFSYSTWGLIFIILVTLFVGFLFCRAKKAHVSVLSALVLIAGVFVLSARMHERYMLPVIALSLMSYIYIKDKRLLRLFIGFTLTNLFNTYDILNRMIVLGDPHVPAYDPFLRLVSLANVILFIYLVKVAYDIIIKGKNPIDNQDNRLIVKLKSFIRDRGNNIPLPNDFKMTKMDILLMTSITAVYLICTLMHLGNHETLKTSWTPQTDGESFVTSFDQEVELSRITYYCALGEGWDAKGEYKLEYYDGAGYTELGIINKDTVFSWKYIGTDVITDRIRLTVLASGGGLGEIGFYTKGGEPVKSIKITEKTGNIGEVNKLFDEQDRVVYQPSYMNSTYFDEIYFARTAYEYFNHLVPYENTHPPLGKIFIALGIRIFGMNPFGWRIIGALFGVVMIPIMYCFGKKVFARTFLAFCLSILMMFDFMHFTQTRIATIDGFATTFIILMYYFMYDYFIFRANGNDDKKALRSLALSGVFFGLGIATKWIAVYSGVGLAVLFFVSVGLNRSKINLKIILWCCVFFVIVPIGIYVLSYIPVITASSENWFTTIINSQKQMLSYHSNLNATHPFSSSWWEWPIIKKPTWYYSGQALEAGRVSTIAAMGNPAIWWVGIMTTFLSGVIAYMKKDKRMFVVFIAIFFQYVPWILVPRITFIYHYFSITPFIMITIVYIIQFMLESYPEKIYLIFGYLLVVILLFIVFFPVLSGMEVSRNYIDGLKWLKSWVF